MIKTEVFYLILLTVLALVGLCYLARDGYRVWLCRRLARPHFVLVARGESFCDEKEYARALLQLSTFLDRPEARYLVREVLVTKTASQRTCEAAETFGLPLSLVEQEELIRRI